MLVTLTTARSRINVARIHRAPIVGVPVRESVGRLAGDFVRAERALPEQDLSAMDGFALRLGRGPTAGPFRLRRIVLTKHPLNRAVLEVGEATYITTGAPLPRGSNAVVRLESAREEAGLLNLRQPARLGQDILRSGESVRRGSRLLEPGRIIRPVDVGALLALRMREVPVFAIRVAILPIGDELAPLAARSGKGVPEYLGPVTAGLLGFADVKLQPPLPDDQRKVAHALRRAARQNDLVITIGGSSVGAKDVTKTALAEVGRLLFEGVTTNVLKRGAVGSIEGTPVIVLPGQVVSAVTVFHEHALHVFSRMVGRELRAFEEARLGERIAVHHRMDSTYLFRLRAGKAMPLPWGVARVTALLQADAFGTLSRGREYRAGDRVRLHRLWRLG